RVLLDGGRRDISRGAEPLLVDPTRDDVEHYRRELAAAGVALGVTVGRFDALLDEVIARAGAGVRPVGGFARQRALEAIAERRSRARMASRGYARELGALIDELRERRVSGRRLRRAIEECALGRHAVCAAEEVEEYEALLLRVRRVDAVGRA